MHITGKQLLFTTYNCFKLLPRGRGMGLMVFREFQWPKKSEIINTVILRSFKKSHRGLVKVLHKRYLCHQISGPQGDLQNEEAR